MSRPLISLGDALRACHHLKPRDAQTVEAILELLSPGATAGADPAPGGVGAWMSSSLRKAEGSDAVESKVPRTFVAPPRRSLPRLPETSAPRAATAQQLRKLESVPRTLRPPSWLTTGQGLEPSTTRRSPPSTPALFGRIHRRGLLSSAVATLEAEGELDVAAIVNRLAQRQALSTLPLTLRATTRRGVQVLIDRGPGMAPFTDDQGQIIDVLDVLLADDRLEIHEFSACPVRGLLSKHDDELENWKPPRRGTPILVLTDLGLGGPRFGIERATVAEWLAFANSARTLGHALIGLIPYEAKRWPARLARAMALLHWSERTTVSKVRSALSDANQRLRV